ncbi:Na+/H+ antiporter NhaC family protein [Kangiella shandongensis]|uniref:Na+/H+ antiporter NhaC family protein n=1 Tax=Kangiella shandongensis TaxID=2763258 RepID=UPI001CBD3609|nr:Na+/H+ antiporter NhaC family protein [Kangiella shandongensis]
MADTSTRQPSMLQALLPVGLLVILLAFSVYLYGSDSSYGANQIALVIAAAVALLVGLRNGQTWKELEKGIVDGISIALAAMLILLMVGALIGAWILSGTVPTMIYYGLQLLSPEYFYVATCAICAVVALSIGSSWTTAGTVGIGLIGVSQGLGLSMEITAGAIISGAYFGDKMSPLSDTTNLAPAVTGTDLFTHIRHMVWTTAPALLLSFIIFTILGINSDSEQQVLALQGTLDLLDNNFNISLWTLVPMAVVFVLAFKKVPAVATILIGALLGCICAVMFQSKVIETFVGDGRYKCERSSQYECSVQNYHIEGDSSTVTFDIAFKNSDDTYSETVMLKEGEDKTLTLGEHSVGVYSHGDFMTTLSATWTSLFSGFSASTGNDNFDNLLSRGGMASMLNTLFLIFTAMSFGAAMEVTGLLHKLIKTVIGMAKSTGSLIGSVLATCIGMNLITADQYISIVLPGRMYKAEFKRRGLDAKNLSRTLEDSATITSPLIPWNTCGAYMAGTLGVATGAYWIYCYFNLLTPLVSFIYALFNFKITPIEGDEASS